MKKQDLAKYKEKFCRVLVKNQNKHSCLFCTVELVNERRVYVTDTKGAWFKKTGDGGTPWKCRGRSPSMPHLKTYGS